MAADTYTLIASPDTSGDYTWLGCAMNQSVGNVITIAPEDTGTYTVISNNEGCCSSDDITISVYLQQKSESGKLNSHHIEDYE